MIDIAILNEKRKLEAYAVKYFIEEYNRRHNNQLVFDSFAEPPDPDVYCFLEGGKIGIEVAHLYGSNRNARMLLGRARFSEQTKEQRIAHALMPLNERLIADLNGILKDKSIKNYGGRIWLLIRNAFPLWVKEDFELYKSDIQMPRYHTFEQMWLLCDRDGKSGILQIYP